MLTEKELNKKYPTSWTIVTPEMAQTWWSKHEAIGGRNRKVKRALVNKYVRDIKADRWMLHHQGAALNCDGSILDGQHRFLAIIETGIAMPMLVTTGLPQDAIYGMDSGGGKTSKDVIDIAYPDKFTNNKKADATASAMRDSGDSGGNKTRQEKTAFMVLHMAAIQWTLEIFDCTAQGVGRASIHGVFGRAYYRGMSDRKKIARFAEVLSTGLYRGKLEESVIRLREWLINNPNKVGHKTNSIAFRRVEYSLDAFLRGKAVSRLAEAEEELFPLPEEE